MVIWEYLRLGRNYLLVYYKMKCVVVKALDVKEVGGPIEHRDKVCFGLMGFFEFAFCCVVEVMSIIGEPCLCPYLFLAVGRWQLQFMSNSDSN